MGFRPVATAELTGSHFALKLVFPWVFRPFSFSRHLAGSLTAARVFTPCSVSSQVSYPFFFSWLVTDMDRSGSPQFVKRNPSLHPFCTGLCICHPSFLAGISSPSWFDVLFQSLW